MRRVRLTLTVLTALLVALLFTSCTKKEESATTSATAKGGLLDSELLGKLPVASLGFFIWDTGSEAYRRFKASPYGEQGLNQILEAVKGQSDSEVKTAYLSVLGVLTKSGLISTEEKSIEEPVKQGLAFVEYAAPAQLPSLGVYLAGKQGVNMQDKLASISSAFQGEGFTVQQKDVSGVKGLVVAVPETMRSDIPLEQFFVGANPSHLAVSTSESTVGRLFGSPTDSGFDKLKASPDFGRTTSKLSTVGGQIGFAYLDVEKVISAIDQSPLKNADAKTAEELKSFPIGALALTQAMGETPSGVLTVTLNPKNEEQKKVLSNLATAGKGDLIEKSPASLMFFVSIDGNVLVNAKNAALASVPSEEVAPFKDVIDLVDSLKSVGVGVKDAGAGSPFPEVLLMFQSSNASLLRDKIQEQLKLAVSSAGLPLAGWQEKDVNGVKVSYTMTPLGVGIYIGTTDDRLIVASSETALSDFVASGKGSNALAGSLSASSKQLVSAPVPIITVYSNFEKLAAMMESMQGTMAMFTGGQASAQTQSMIDQWKKLGSVIAAIDYEGGVLRMRAGYDQPSKAAKRS